LGGEKKIGWYGSRVADREMMDGSDDKIRIERYQGIINLYNRITKGKVPFSPLSQYPAPFF